MNWMCEWFGVCSRLIISTRALIGMANGKEGILFGCSFKFQIIVSWDKCLINLEKGFCVVVREEKRMGQKVNKFTQHSTYTTFYLHSGSVSVLGAVSLFPVPWWLSSPDFPRSHHLRP